MSNQIPQQSYKQPTRIHDPSKERLLMQKALDAFESMYIGVQVLKGGTISFDAYKMYLRNYFADPEIRARADYLWKEYRTPKQARKAVELAELAESGMIGGAAAGIIKEVRANKGYVGRRTLLQLSPFVAAAYLAACGGKNGGGNPLPGPGPSPIYVSFQVPVEGLLRQTKLNGELRIPGKPLVIPIVNGIMTVEQKHELMAGQTHNNAEMNTNQGVARITPVKVTNSNLLVPIGYTDVPLDAVDDQNIFDIWANTRSLNLGVKRFDTYATNLRKFVYDRTKFRDTGQALVEDGQMSPLPTKALNTIERVVNTYVGPFVNNLTPSGNLVRESQSSERPGVSDRGWLIYRFGDDVRINGNSVAISAGDDAELNRGEITRGALDMNLQNFSDSSSAMINDPNNGLAAIVIDTHEVTMASRGGSFPIVIGGNTFRPLEEILAISKIQYNRRIRNASNGVPDYQTM